jgi:[ribosomal protein S5]-alanine N-acetyltransferase
MVDGKNVIFRPLKEKDLDEFFRAKEKLRVEGENLFLDDLSSEYKFKQKFTKTGFWEELDGVIVLLDRKEHMLGFISFRNTYFFDSLDLSYYIFRPEDRGKGIMSESLLLFSRYLFSTKKINRLQLNIPNYNRAAMAVAQKCGFSFEGILREALFCKGKYVDLCVYAMLRSECKNMEKF